VLTWTTVSGCAVRKSSVPGAASHPPGAWIERTRSAPARGDRHPETSLGHCEIEASVTDGPTYDFVACLPASSFGIAHGSENGRLAQSLR